jgi:chromosomal replication initiation ATPase DnaA
MTHKLTTTAFPLSFLRGLETKFNVNIDLEYNEYLKENPAMILDERMQNIIQESCIILQMNVTDLIGKSRQREYVLLRQLLMDYFYNKFPVSLRVIGLQFGGRDHSTVLHSRYQIENLRDTKDNLLAYYESKLAELLV